MADDDKILVRQLRLLAMYEPDEINIYITAAFVRRLADRIEALSAENERLKKILRDCDPESMSWLDARDAALGETE